MSDPPTTPGDERNGEPYYINSECPSCETALELYDEASGWFDEWYCPSCDDGIYMDWPQEEYDTNPESAVWPKQLHEYQPGVL